MRKHTPFTLALAAAALIAGASSAAPPEPIDPGLIPTDRPWYVCPEKPDTTSRYYPEKALRREIEGEARIACKLLPSGKPSQCIWIHETPPGFGFGAAGERTGCHFQFTMEANTPPIVSSSLRFKLPGRPARQ